ncbi:hypothetical protein HYH03_012774 [Edaphochlamys debaryana]|uniref:Uncharacterized protein n=1 Tax=Edaphochlamys debaryana TaxID=47281 RepID=A0A835XPM1_9CHLO|nr:hypothetical protein HYH03_012774 [Edaphochlamys debaryana]|eukprot:KAG2488777.1 hypothetical protein HYH03_012774 [Edaphochlamys debaryana]
MADESKLKRLGFVQSYSARLASGAAYVEGCYQAAKPWVVPQAAVPHVAKAEDTVLAYAAPIVTKVSDSAEQLLLNTDAKVDQFFLSTANMLTHTRELTKANLDAFAGAADKYYQMVKSTADYLTAKLSTDLSVAKAREVLGHSLDKAKELADPDAAVRAVYDAWQQFAAIPAVAKTLATAAPVTTKTFEAFVAAHDKLVTSPLYKRSVSLGASTLGWAATTTPYKLGATYLYPFVQTVADPALDKVAKSTYINATLKYWAPVAAA